MRGRGGRDDRSGRDRRPSPSPAGGRGGGRGGQGGRGGRGGGRGGSSNRGGTIRTPVALDQPDFGTMERCQGRIDNNLKKAINSTRDGFVVSLMFM